MGGQRTLERGSERGSFRILSQARQQREQATQYCRLL